MPTWLLNKYVLGGIGLFLIVGLGWFFHAREVSQLKQEYFDKGVKHEQDRITEKVARITTAAEKVSTDVRKITDAKLNHIAGSASVVLMRGPGKAACGPAVSQPSGEPRRSDPAGSTPVVDVPAGERQPLFGLPASGAITLAAQHDNCIAKIKAWNDWYSQQAEIWKNAK